MSKISIKDLEKVTCYLAKRKFVIYGTPIYFSLHRGFIFQEYYNYLGVSVLYSLNQYPSGRVETEIHVPAVPYSHLDRPLFKLHLKVPYEYVVPS